MYDPLDFKRGIEQLAGAESRSDTAHRKSILEMMLSDLETVGGNLASELVDYVAELSLFDDPVDLQKLTEIHGDLAMIWASSTDYELSKEKERVEVLLPIAERYQADKEKESAKNAPARCATNANEQIKLLPDEHACAANDWRLPRRC